jgi:hypothetical protein
MVYVRSGAVSADRLRDGWRSRSMRAGWSMPSDWWAPAVETVAEAVAGGLCTLGPGARLGRARGRAGVGLGETLDDLGALSDAAGWPDPPLPFVRAVAEGWVDAGVAGMAAPTCEDPLTGLVSLQFLRSRLAEIYREAIAVDVPAADTHGLVLVELASGAPSWRRLARAVVIGHDLRAVFRGGETLTMVGSGRAAALVPLRSRLEPQMARLRRELDDHAMVWLERLPATHREAMSLLDALS